MKEPKLSIILPIYNTEAYLEKCLDSILGNTFQDFELIIVNDGSPDNSEEIILKYIEKYKDKIVYIKKENGGLSDARNTGLSIAKGEYISFIDSDDYIERNMYEEIFTKLKEASFDIVSCDVNLVYENSEKIDTVSCGYRESILDKEKIKESMTVFYPTVWNKVYKREVLKDITFLKGVWYEDLEFMLRAYPNINSIGVVKKPLYNYLQRKNSITYTYNDKLYDIINNMESVLKYYKEHNIYEEYKEVLEYLYVRYAFATFPKRLAKCGNKGKYKEGINYAYLKVKEHFPNYKNNKYLKEMGLKGLYIKHFNNLLSNINYLVQNSKKYN